MGDTFICEVVVVVPVAMVIPAVDFSITDPPVLAEALGAEVDGGSGRLLDNSCAVEELGACTIGAGALEVSADCVSLAVVCVKGFDVV